MTNDLMALTKGINVKAKQSLDHYTFTKTGGQADFLAFPKNADEVSQLVRSAHQLKMPIIALGNASNLIVSDRGIRGLVVMLTEMKQIQVTHQLIMTQSGTAIIDAAIVAQRHQLSGLEFAAGIPGSVGGAIYMNAGAYGGQTASVVQSVQIVDENGDLRTLNCRQLQFGYRHSIIQDHDWIVVGATFKMQLDDRADIQARMDHFNALRMSKQPLAYPSCGSVFKRPIGHFAGKLIHDAGLQGYRSGDAQVSLKHAGFIINLGHATAQDYLNVIHHVQTVVYEREHIHLETEVRLIGEK